MVAKAAGEEIAAYCARHTPARVLVVRRPEDVDRATNTPLGRFGAVPKEQVAAAITRWLDKRRSDARRAGLLGPADLI